MRTDDDGRLAYSIPRFCRKADISRSTCYQEIKAGRLRVVKIGKRTLITADEARAYFARLPEGAERQDS